MHGYFDAMGWSTGNYWLPKSFPFALEWNMEIYEVIFYDIISYKWQEGIYLYSYHI